MIIEKNLPYGLRSMTCATIKSSMLHCVIMTSKTSVFSRRWMTLIYRGNPLDIDDFTPYANYRYREELDKESVLAAHNDALEFVDALAEQGGTLFQAFDQLVLYLNARHLVDGPVEMAEAACEDERLEKQLGSSSR